MRAPGVAVAANAASLACLVVAAVRWETRGWEGAYFNRSVGADAAAGSALGWWELPQAPWLLASALLLVVGLGALLRAVRTPTAAG